MSSFFERFVLFESFIWGYLAIPVMIVISLYLSFYSRWMQVRQFTTAVRYFFHCLRGENLAADGQAPRGITPLQAFFASMGGCIGVGNVVGVCTAIQIGGPGAALWMWFAALLGMILRYAEVYLGIKYRQKNAVGGYDGGPMYFIYAAFKKPWLASLVAFLLCIYGVEIYIFDVVKDSIVHNWQWPSLWVTVGLLVLVLIGGSGGVRRVGIISEWMIPTFMVGFIGMVVWILVQNFYQLPLVFSQIFSSAFTGHAATGAFIGSTFMVALSRGFARGCYSGDIGIGYASIIQSEAHTTQPHKQAALAIFGIFLDTFIVCSFSIVLILTTDLWKDSIEASVLVQTALGNYFPYMHLFMPIFIFLLGYSTIIAFFCVGVKCAQYLSPKYGKVGFYLYAICAFISFSFIESAQAISIIATAGAILLIINSYAIFHLRREIEFDLKKTIE